MKPKIPNGWRVLRASERIRDGDTFSYYGFEMDYLGTKVSEAGFTRIGSTLASSRKEYAEWNKGEESPCVVIRRIAKKAGGKRK